MTPAETTEFEKVKGKTKAAKSKKSTKALTNSEGSHADDEKKETAAASVRFLLQCYIQRRKKKKFHRCFFNELRTT